MNPARGAQRTLGKSRAAVRLMTDLQPLAGAGKQHGMLAHYLSGAGHGKTDAARRARPDLPFAAVNRAVSQLPSARPGYRFAHPQSRAGWGIGLVAMMGF